MHAIAASDYIYSMLTKTVSVSWKTLPSEFSWPPCALCAGEPGQLEASLRQLDQALDAGRYHLQQREATANRSSPDIDSTYMGYVSLLSFLI